MRCLVSLRPGAYIPMADPQQRPPAGWCPACGMEIWTPGRNLCEKCLAREREEADE